MAAVRLLEQGVEELGADTQFGGEAQLWLALSYQVGVGRKPQLPRGGGWPAGDHACTGIGFISPWILVGKKACTSPSITASVVSPFPAPSGMRAGAGRDRRVQVD